MVGGGSEFSLPTASESDSDASCWGSILDMTSSSSPSSSSSSSSEADASSATKEGRLDFVFAGADLRRGGAGVLVDLEAGRGGLKAGTLRFGAGFEVVGGIATVNNRGQ